MRVEIYGCDTEPIHVRVVSDIMSSIEVDGIEYSLKVGAGGLQVIFMSDTYTSAVSCVNVARYKRYICAFLFERCVKMHTLVLSCLNVEYKRINLRCLA